MCAGFCVQCTYCVFLTFIISFSLHEVIIGVGLMDPQDPIDGVGRVAAQRPPVVMVQVTTMSVVLQHGMVVGSGRTGADAPTAVAAHLGLLGRLVADNAVDAGDTGHALLVADPFRQQPVPDLPGEHGGVLLLVLADGVHHVGCGHLGLAPADHARLEVPCLVVAGEDLGDAAV